MTAETSTPAVEQTTLTRAITIRQPWASCIAIGRKTVENRGRWTSHRGLIAIHAGKAPDRAADRDPRVVRLYGRDPRIGMPVGAIVAVATLTDCHEATTTGRLLGSEPCCPPWGEASYNSRPAWHLVLADARMLARPVAARGSLSVPWTLPADVAAEVQRQLDALVVTP